MKKCFYYFLIEPVREIVKDDGTNVAFEVPIDGVSVKTAFLTYEDGQPKALRFEISSLETEMIPESILDVIHTSKEHFLTVLQVTYEKSARYGDAAVWNYVETDSGPTMNLRFTEQLNPPVNEVLRTCFVDGMKHRHLLQLLAHGADTHFPLPLRFLSLYKLLEHRFKTKGKWDKEQLKEFLEPYDEVWKAKGFNRAPHKLVHDIRDRCAHARMNSDALGIMSLKRKDAAEVDGVLSDMLVIGKTIVSDLTGGAIGFGSIPGTAGTPN